MTDKLKQWSISWSGTIGAWVIDDATFRDFKKGDFVISNTLTAGQRREALTATLSAAWHALQSYANGNTAPDLALEVAQAIERTAKMLEITLDR